MALSYILGRRSTTFTHSEDSVIVTTKTGAKRTFADVCKDVTPPCNLSPLLFNGHLQTFWTAMKPHGPPIHYKRRVFAAEDPVFSGHFAVDFAVHFDPKEGRGTGIDEGLHEDPMGVGHYSLPPRTVYFTDQEFATIGSDDMKPMLITLHGLSGGSHEVYLRHVLAPLVTETAEGKKAGGLSGGDWETIVINSRGCAGSKVTSAVLYNARATWDIRQTVKWCRKTWPNRPLFAIGFSLGANILANYLAEEGSACEFKSAILISNPWNLEVSSNALQRTYIGLEIYSRTMGGNMRKLFETHQDSILKNTKINPDDVAKVTYLHDFDREVQCATWGYPTEGAYYRDASSVDSVLDIRIPTLCLGAKDDPIAADEAVPYSEIKKNPYVVHCTTGGGGHLGWFETMGGRWHARAAASFLRNVQKDLDFSKTQVVKGLDDELHGAHKTPFVFTPMRRRLCLPESEHDRYQPDCF